VRGDAAWCKARRGKGDRKGERERAAGKRMQEQMVEGERCNDADADADRSS
jgi:hypothetical protein